MSKPRISEDNFGFELFDDEPSTDDKGYFDDLERSDSAVGFESSFPLPISVAKSVDRFENIPQQAMNPPSSTLSILLGTCPLVLKTASVQADRFLLADRWIKLSEGVPAGVRINLEPRMDLNIKITTKLAIDIQKNDLDQCRKLLSGRRVYLGRFHLNKSKIGLLAGPGYPPVVFSSRSLEPKGKRVFLRWEEGATTPSLIDDLDFSATSESSIFRAFMAEKGAYYLIFEPVLRMDQVEQVMIKIPFQVDKKTTLKELSRKEKSSSKLP